MKQKMQIPTIILLMFSLIMLILDSKTSLKGAQEGLSLCISVVIPSLFPFIFLSALIPDRLIGKQIKCAKGFWRLFGIPDGAESLLVLSFLGGYPLGASMITEEYKSGNISYASASRMLGFCNNAGPAFLFGIVGSIFHNQKAVWLLWLIHIFSAFLVAFILPEKRTDFCTMKKREPVSLTKALEISIQTMCNICGWIIIFRTVLSILDHWLLWLFPPEIRIGIYGILELSNGIIGLKELGNPGLCFILCSGFLAFGGVCVFMQTISATKGLGLGQYFPGKVLQCLFSILLSSVLQYIVFSYDSCIQVSAIFYISAVAGIVAFLHLIKKKSSSISGAYVV